MTNVIFFKANSAPAQYRGHEEAKEIAKEIGVVNEVDADIEVEDHYQRRHREIAARSGQACVWQHLPWRRLAWRIAPCYAGYRRICADRGSWRNRPQSGEEKERWGRPANKPGVRFRRKKGVGYDGRTLVIRLYDSVPRCHHDLCPYCGLA